MQKDLLKQDHLVLVTCLRGLKRLPQGEITYRRWLYLGKDVKRTRRVEWMLGKEHRWECGEKLHQAAANLRQPFLDFVADIGAQQRDQLSWWSSRFSWKMWTASDLFLLICFLSVAQEIIQEAISRKIGLLLVVEDCWLAHQLEENLAGLHANVHFAHVGWLGREKSRAIVLGIARRAWWLWTMLRNYIRQRWVWPGETPDPPSGPTVAIYSYPLLSSLQNSRGWHDPQLPGLDRILQELGYEVIRFSPPDCVGFEAELAMRRAYFRPLILWATVGGIWRSLRAFWWPRWPGHPSVNGLPVQRLVEREWWMEIGRSSLCSFRMFYECLRGMLRRGEWRWIAIPYENQPWEKMIVLSAQESGIRVVGIQNAILSRYYLPYFLGAGEAERMPLPDIICVSGPYAYRVLIEGGNPPERLHLCGSIRYPHVNGSSPQKLTSAPRSEILVILPIDPYMCEHLLAAIRAAFPTGGVEEGLRFHIRPHPMLPVRSEHIGFPAKIIPSDFHDLTAALRACGLVIFYGSTVGFEALAVRRAVLRYRCELLLDVDEVYDDVVPVCSDDDFRDAVLTLVRDRRHARSADSPQEIVPPLFASFDRRKLEDVLLLR